LYLIFGCGLGCDRRDSPHAAFDHAYKTFLHGDLKRSQEEAHRGCDRFRDSNPELAWKFRILEAETLLLRGMSPEALALLNPRSTQPTSTESVIEILTIKGIANARFHSFSEAARSLEEAERLCSGVSYPNCGSVIRAQGVLAIERGQLATSRKLFENSLSFAQKNGDHFLEASALLNLGVSSLREEHFDEAVDWAEAALESANAIDAGAIATKALGNLGWAYYNLGDLERSLKLSEQAVARSVQLANVIDQLSYLNNSGYVYAEIDDLQRANQAYLEALALAQEIQSKQHIYNALRALALVSVESSRLAEAEKYADEAIKITHSDNNRLDELYPLLVKGLIAARSQDSSQAEQIFREVERDPSGNPALKWRSEHALAQLYEDEKRPDAAEREYRAALTTFEAARSSLRRNDSKLPFSNNAARIYDDYIHFLVSQKRPDDALRWADYSRARTLSEGLGLLTKESSTATSNFNPQKPVSQKINPQQIAAPQIAPPQIAKRLEGTILFYWLGEKQSYLWTITPQRSILSTLPPGREINAAAERYRKSLQGPQNVLASADPDGVWLYRTLITPAQPSLNSKKDEKVFIIPDGSLNNLNFETLIVSEPVPEAVGTASNRTFPKPHYWIEDVTVSNASSLRVLAAASASRNNETTKNKNKNKDKEKRSLLLVGNSVAPNDKYPELPKAGAQMESVARHFPSSQQQIFAREHATPAAYLDSNPERFSYIHFVAHGTASRLSPLDSAIVLSKGGQSEGGQSQAGNSQTASSDARPSNALPSKTFTSIADPENDTFKLYARDIIRHPLRADLVTISACYGAGERAYSGEGLVGLSWAFLRAGAHNVIGALWEATDSSTEQLMDKFYDEIDKGATPDAALRTAKLSLLRESAFSNPFYWAPFQLYTGS
jgi:CHAT domain-containing protein